MLADEYDACQEEEEDYRQAGGVKQGDTKSGDVWKDCNKSLGIGKSELNAGQDADERVKDDEKGGRKARKCRRDQVSHHTCTYSRSLTLFSAYGESRVSTTGWSG